jgi:hypothetical protein
MDKINARSPYFITASNVGLEEYDKLLVDIYIYKGTWSVDKPSSPTYTLLCAFLNNKVSLDVSEIVNDYLQVEFDGTYSTEPHWVELKVRLVNEAGGPAPTSTYLRGFKGYGYFEEGSNPLLEQSILISNDIIYKLDDEAINIPIDTENTVRVSFEDADGTTFTTPITSSTISSAQVEYVSNFVDESKNFISRVTEDGGVTEPSQCLKKFNNDYVLFPTKKIYVESSDGTIEVVNVKNIEECKYEPHKLTFINKFGVLQDLWFFKTSKLSMNVKDKMYRSNTIVDGVYSINKHQYRTLFKTGKQSLSLSSGFYSESYNEVFKQLFLSDKVWINYKGKTLPVNIKSKEMSFKTSLNDSLIEYKIDVEFAYDTINSVR